MNTRWFVAGFGVVFIGVGLYGVVEPIGLKQFAELFSNPGGLWTAVALRLTIGAMLWLSAGASRTPRVVRALAILFLLSAIALPLIGVSGLRSIIEWASGLSNGVLRGAGLLAAGFGAFLVWTAYPRRSEG